MNQVTKMFQESNNRMKKIMRGDYVVDQIASAQREFEGQIKLLNAVVSAFAVQSKNKRAKKDLQNMNLIETTTAVDMMLGDPEVDKVKCPLTGRLITRCDCLDYSGDHYDECKGCEIGGETKEMLLENNN